jgi:hypothetical protein
VRKNLLGCGREDFKRFNDDSTIFFIGNFEEGDPVSWSHGGVV